MSIYTRIALILLIVSPYNRSVAQLCQGSLGDPIVNITFGEGNNPGAALSAATTAYNYNSVDCPDDGFYAVRNSSYDCFASSWHSIATDHTGNHNGYFMLVNASLQPSAFYVDTVRGLCSNTTFEFAAWIMNVLKPMSCPGGAIQPNLTFTISKIDGTVLQTYTTGFIASQLSPQWRQYGFFFTMPSDVSDVILYIFNNSHGGCGNDLALDDITFRPCGPQITASVQGYSTNTISYCETAARSFNFSATLSAGYNDPAYQWQQSSDGHNWTDIAAANSTNYTVNLGANAEGVYYYRLAAAERSSFSSEKCRVVSQVISITKGRKPVTNMSITSPACEGAPVTFSAGGGSNYQWYRDGGGLGVKEAVFTIPVADINLTGKIYVKVEGSGGCFAIDSTILTILPKPNGTVSFNSASICVGRSIQLDAAGGVSYSWSPSIGLSGADAPDPLATPTTTTNYVVTVTGSNSCTDKDTVAVHVIENIVADAGADKIIIKGDAVQLVNTTVEGTYLWSPNENINNVTVKEPVVSPQQDINYILTATSLAGCNTDMDTVHVFVYNDIYIPKAFSPDGNGINDTWNIPALQAFPDFELYVYNRSGKIVYQCKNLFIPWDGYYKASPLDPGSYVYFIKLNDAKSRVLKGSLVLLR